jgi:hypothetical protein
MLQFGLKIYLANYYNFVIVVRNLQDRQPRKAFGVAEVEKPQLGGAGCGYTFARAAERLC